MQDWSDRIFQQYTARLVALARSRMHGGLQSRFDPEDVVMSAWRSFFCGALGQHEGGSESLWPLLATLTLRKLSKSRRRHFAAKRAIQATVELSELQNCAAIAAEDPTVEDLAVAAELKQAMLSEFSCRDQRMIEMSIEGWLQSDIANQLAVSDRTVRRVLHLARMRLQGIADFRAAPIPAPQQRPSMVIVPSLQQISYSDILLKKLIGTGSFGKVFEAEWRPTQTRIAVKFLRKRFWQHASARHQFLQDVELVSRITHLNVIKYQGWGESPHGGPFVVMEFIDGTTLCHWISKNRSLKDKLEILLAIASALASAHAKGVVHGDLSPSNILVDSIGRAVLTDFGFAQSLALRDPRSVVGGTLGFASPEQLNAAFGELNAAADMYAWGAVAWFLLVGSPLSKSNEPFAMIFDTISARPHNIEVLSELRAPRELFNCVTVCLNKQSRLRMRAAEVIVVLDKLLNR